MTNQSRNYNMSTHGQQVRSLLAILPIHLLKGKEGDTMPWENGLWYNLVHDDYMGVPACGSHSDKITSILQNVTCPKCIHLLKMSHWFCDEHGFIADTLVTNDERCSRCGSCAKGHI